MRRLWLSFMLLAGCANPPTIPMEVCKYKVVLGSGTFYTNTIDKKENGEISFTDNKGKKHTAYIYADIQEGSFDAPK